MSQIDRVRNDKVRRRAGIERELASRADQRVLRWFGHVQRMDEYRMARSVLMAEVSGGRVRGRLRLGWMDVVKVALGNRGMTVEAMRLCAKDRKTWRENPPWWICNWMSSMRLILPAPVCCRTALPCSGGYHLEKGGMLLYGTVGINCKKGATTKNQGIGAKYIWAKICMMDYCVSVVWFDMTTHPWWREKVMVYYKPSWKIVFLPLKMYLLPQLSTKEAETNRILV